MRFYHISSNKNCDEEGLSEWDWLILFSSGLENNVSVSIKETVGKAVQVSNFLMSWWWGQSPIFFQSDCNHSS